MVYKNFNTVQSCIFDDLLNTDKSVVLCAPTGSGKTVGFEFAIVRMLSEAEHHGLNVKGIYVASLKSLCAERFADWDKRFGQSLVKCVQITGDSESDDLMAIDQAQIVITTPEKWDSITRRWHDCSAIMSSVQLFMVDEIHLLNDEVRGATLEAIITRMMVLGPRFVFASATIPNIEDLLTWLANGGLKNPVKYVFSDEDRPVPLDIHVLGFPSNLKSFQFDIKLNFELPKILRKYSEGKAALVFCNCRKSAELAAVSLTKFFHFYRSNDSKKANLMQIINRIHDDKLRQVLQYGIAFHHAGLTFDDRNAIEDGFRNGIVMLLFCTSTLAMGLNLPAHLVVVKSTEAYYMGPDKEYPASTVIQMIGRAGRSQFDKKGIAVILTRNENVVKYKNLHNCQAPIESHLQKHLVEHLNLEIASDNIREMSDALRWLRTTFFYVRAMRDPRCYGFDVGMDRVVIEQKMEDLCLRYFRTLEEEKLIEKSTTSYFNFQSTVIGKLMAKYCLSFDTIRIFNQIRGTETFLDILKLIAKCKEFDDCTLRLNEKKTLNELNAKYARFPILGRIKTREEKVLCLIQAVLSKCPIESRNLSDESIKIMRTGMTLASCVLEYMREQSDAYKSGCYKALMNAVIIAKCFHAKMWEDSSFSVTQLENIDLELSKLLTDAGKGTLQAIAGTDARTIEKLLNKPIGFGDVIVRTAQGLPCYELAIERKSVDVVEVKVSQSNKDVVEQGHCALIVGDSANKVLLFDDNLETLSDQSDFSKIIPLTNLNVGKVDAHLIHNCLVGLDVHKSIVINELLQEEKDPQEMNRLIPVKNSIKRKKRLRQETIFVKKSKKSTFRNNMIREQIFDNEQEGKTSQNHVIDLCVESTQNEQRLSASLEDNTLINLQSFIFNKNILKAESKPQRRKTEPICDGIVSSPGSPSAHASVNQITTTQKKITEYYGQVKVLPGIVSDQPKIVTNTCFPKKFEKIQKSQEAEEFVENPISHSSTKMLPWSLTGSEIAATDCIMFVDKKKEVPQDPIHIRNKVDNTLKPNKRFTQISSNSKIFSEICPSAKASDCFIQNEKNFNIVKSQDSNTNTAKDISSENIFHWYKVAQAFAKLKSEQQNLNNFNKLHNSITLRSKIISSSPVDYGTFHRQAAEELIKPIASTASSSNAPSARFRLQIKNCNVPPVPSASSPLDTKIIDTINCNVLNFILDERCKENNHTIAFDQLREDNLSALEKELLFTQESESESRQNKTFEDYCDIFMNNMDHTTDT